MYLSWCATMCFLSFAVRFSVAACVVAAVVVAVIYFWVSMFFISLHALSSGQALSSVCRKQISRAFKQMWRKHTKYIWIPSIISKFRLIFIQFGKRCWIFGAIEIRRRRRRQRKFTKLQRNRVCNLVEKYFKRR